jgi:hypothetical protein
MPSTSDVMPSTVDVDIWGYPDEAAAGRDLTGYSIEAIDGSIGKVDNANNDTGASWLIVDTGPWIFGKKVMLPAGVVSRINSETEVLRVNRTKEQIKNAPEFDEARHLEQTYRDELGGYYGPGGSGYQA